MALNEISRWGLKPVGCILSEFDAFNKIKRFKVTRHLCFKNSKNLHPLDIVGFNSANKPSFQNPTKSLFFFHLWSIGQKGFLTDFEKMVY